MIGFSARTAELNALASAARRADDDGDRSFRILQETVGLEIPVQAESLHRMRPVLAAELKLTSAIGLVATAAK